MHLLKDWTAMDTANSIGRRGKRQSRMTKLESGIWRLDIGGWGLLRSTLRGPRGWAQQEQLTAAIFGPGGFLMPRDCGPFFTHGDGLDHGGIHTEADQRFANALRAAFAEGAIVFLGPTFIAMTFNAQGFPGVRGFHFACDSLQLGNFAWAYISFVVIEKNRLVAERCAVGRPIVEIPIGGGDASPGIAIQRFAVVFVIGGGIRHARPDTR